MARDTNAVLAEFPELITIGDLMDYLKCSRTKANEICRKKYGFSFKIGGTWYVDRDKFVTWMNRQCRV